MLNFTVGPVQINEKIRAMGSNQIPYFRTPDFSAVMKENEMLIKKFLNAPENARAVFMTGSGTCSMEATVMNVFTPEDKLLVVKGGSFGARFLEICTIHDIPHENIALKMGESLKEKHLSQYENSGFTGLLVNVHETSTGVLYDLAMIHDFCHRNNMLLIVDAISSFIADPLDMSKMEVDAVIIGSQKALALAPGISIIALSDRAISRIQSHKTKCMYLDLNAALKNGERGQTPFTPAVGTLLQLIQRLKDIDKGGMAAETKRIADLAADFRKKIEGLPFEIVSESMSNAVTPLCAKTASAYRVFEILKDEYEIWVCPNGGELADILFRVGHIGDLTVEDNDVLINALRDLQRRNII